MRFCLLRCLLGLVAVCAVGACTDNPDDGRRDVIEAGPPCGDGGLTCGAACVDLASDPHHCGACGQGCPAPANAAPTCVASRCGFACVGRSADCDGDPANGCEALLESDPAHCGACGTRCPGRENAAGVCRNGACALECRVGYADCDGDPANGCETEIATDWQNCGACGTRCVSNTTTDASCVGGACRQLCREGYADCDGDVTNGCETDLRANTGHCGSCGNACAAGPNSRPVCRAGSCAVQCNTGFADCNLNPADGCEMFGTCT